MRKSRSLGMGLGILILAACSGEDSTTAPTPIVIEETWCINQGAYIGTLTIRIEGAAISGDMDWSGFPDAVVSGSTANRGTDSTLYDMLYDYSPSLQGIYRGTRRKGTNQMSGRTHAILDGTPDWGGETGWSATKGACPA